MSTSTKPKTYNRRGWWPSGWSVIKRGRKWNVENIDKDKVISAGHECEFDAISESDCLATKHKGN